jgi:hypothetical protein
MLFVRAKKMIDRETIEEILIKFHVGAEINGAMELAVDDIEKLIRDHSYVTLGWTWAEACYITNKGLDIRKYNKNLLSKQRFDVTIKKIYLTIKAKRCIIYLLK